MSGPRFPRRQRERYPLRKGRSASFFPAHYAPAPRWSLFVLSSMLVGRNTKGLRICTSSLYRTGFEPDVLRVGVGLRVAWGVVKSCHGLRTEMYRAAVRSVRLTSWIAGWKVKIIRCGQPRSWQKNVSYCSYWGPWYAPPNASKRRAISHARCALRACASGRL